MTTFLDFRTEPIIETPHEVTVDGLTVTCNYIYCNYEESFDTMDDVEIAVEVHRNGEEEDGPP